MRRFSICNEEVHDARKCPNDSHNLTVKSVFDGISKSQAKRLQKSLMNLKDKCAPDGRLTTVIGTRYEMNRHVKDERDNQQYLENQ